MSKIDSILMYDTSLGRDARRRIKQIRWADVLIGIPTHRNARTLGEVLDAVSRGLGLYLSNRRVVLMDADGGSSDNTVREFVELDVPRNVEKLIVAYEGPTGKGTAIRSIFGAAVALAVKACAVVEARAPGISPDWMPGLIDPAFRGDDIVFGCYERSAYAAALTDNLAYPFVRMFCNADLRDPLASEFCVSRGAAEELANWDIWETDVTRFGVNAWIAMHCLARGLRISQAGLGFRGEGSGEPGALGDARFTQSIGTLFRLLSIHRRFWQSSPPEHHIPSLGDYCSGRVLPCPECGASLVNAVYDGRSRYEAMWRRVLASRTLKAFLSLLDGPGDEFVFPLDLWVRIVLEFAVVYNEGEGDPDRVIEALLPIFPAPAATYMRETEGLSTAQREQVVQQICDAFLGARTPFLQKWNRYYSSLDDLGIY